MRNLGYCAFIDESRYISSGISMAFSGQADGPRLRPASEQGCPHNVSYVPAAAGWTLAFGGLVGRLRLTLDELRLPRADATRHHEMRRRRTRDHHTPLAKPALASRAVGTAEWTRRRPRAKEEQRTSQLRDGFSGVSFRLSAIRLSSGSERACILWERPAACWLARKPCRRQLARPIRP